MLISFLVVLDPRIVDFNQVLSLLSQYNYFIDNQIGFDNIQILNETNSKSALLPNTSSFTSKKKNKKTLYFKKIKFLLFN